eukprot:418766_1
MSSSINVKQITQICLLFIIWLIISPIMLRWMYKIILKKHHIIMQKRYVQLSLLSCILCIIWIIIALPLHILQNVFINKIGLDIIVNILYSILNYCILYTLLARFTMFYFYQNWNDITLSSHWIVHIRKPSSKDKERAKRLQLENRETILLDLPIVRPMNDNTLHAETNQHTMINNEPILAMHHLIQFPCKIAESWFVKNRRKYGSVLVILHRLWSPWMLSVSIIMCIEILAAYYKHIVYFILIDVIILLLLLMPCIAIIYLWKHTPKTINDSFFFRDEMRNLFITITTVCCLYSLLILLTTVNRLYTSNIFDIIVTIFDEVFVIFTCVIILYYQTEWLIVNIKKRESSLDCCLYNTTIENEKTSENYTEIINESEIYRKLSNILQHEQLFDKFTRYLASELSIELSFAFIEFIQFKLLIERDPTFYMNIEPKDAHKLYSFAEIKLSRDISLSSIAHKKANSEPEDEHKLDLFTEIKLPTNISRSSIVHNKKYARMKPTYRYKKIAKKLTQKYLEFRSEFELPISKYTKRNVVEWVKMNCKHLKSPYHSQYSDIISEYASSISTSRYLHTRDYSSNVSSTSTFTDLYCSDQLYHLFDDCRKEIYFLMAHSVERFVISAGYKNIYQLLTRKCGVDATNIILIYSDLPINIFK